MALFIALYPIVASRDCGLCIALRGSRSWHRQAVRSL